MHSSCCTYCAPPLLHLDATTTDLYEPSANNNHFKIVLTRETRQTHRQTILCISSKATLNNNQVWHPRIIITLRITSHNTYHVCVSHVFNIWQQVHKILHFTGKSFLVLFLLLILLNWTRINYSYYAYNNAVPTSIYFYIAFLRKVFLFRSSLL